MHLRSAGLFFAAAIVSACSLFFPIDDGYGEGGDRGDAGVSDAPGFDDVALDAVPSRPRVLVSGEKRPHEIVVDRSSIYWETEGQTTDAGSTRVDGEIVRLDRTPGASRRVLAAAIGNGRGLVADDTTLWWLADEDSRNGRIARVEKDGTGRDAILEFLYSYPGLGVDALHVFTSRPPPFVVKRATKAGDGVLEATTGLPYTRVVFADGISLLVSSGGQIFAVDKDDLDKSVLFAATSFEVTALATDDTSVFWISEAGGRVFRLRRADAGQQPTEVAIGQKSPSAVATGGGNVYWTNRGDGTVMRAPASGGSPIVVASGQEDPVGIAADDRAVFWTNAGDGTVMTAD